MEYSTYNLLNLSSSSQLKQTCDKIRQSRDMQAKNCSLDDKLDYNFAKLVLQSTCKDHSLIRTDIATGKREGCLLCMLRPEQSSTNKQEDSAFDSCILQRTGGNFESRANQIVFQVRAVPFQMNYIMYEITYITSYMKSCEI